MTVLAHSSLVPCRSTWIVLILSYSSDHEFELISESIDNRTKDSRDLLLQMTHLDTAPSPTHAPNGSGHIPHRLWSGFLPTVQPCQGCTSLLVLMLRILVGFGSTLRSRPSWGVG